VREGYDYLAHCLTVGARIRGPRARLDDRLALWTRWRSAEHQERRVAGVHGRPQGLAVFAARPDQRLQLQEARGRLALQDRQPWHTPRVQVGGHAPDGQGRHLRHRRHAALGRGARRENRRAALDAQPARGHPRRYCSATVIGTRRVVLDRRQGRRPRRLRDDRIPAGRAQREKRPADRVVWASWI
jgi:hypothetical protein